MFSFTLSIADIRRGMKAAATLDTRLCKEEWLRCYTFTRSWRPGVDLAKYDNGSGDDIYIFFLEGGAFLKGFDHESDVSLHARADGQVWPGMYLGLPEAFAECLQDESVRPEEVTFCFWMSATDNEWQQGPVEFPDDEDDGARYLLSQLPTSADSYRDWAQEYYERELDLSEVQAVFSA